jgi:hypothetical protein
VLPFLGRMTASPRLASVVLVLSALGAWGCRPNSGRPLTRPTEDGDAGGIIIDAGPSAPNDGDVPEAMPHVLLAVEPPHGPFSGGTLVLLRGNGFGSNARVWFGDTELDAADVLAIDPHRLQVTAPPGAAGLADVAVQNGDDDSTLVTLSGGYAYDAFYLDPATGPTSGGTLVTINGQGTAFGDDTRVTIDREPCEVVEVRSPTELVCRAPAGTQGAKPVRVMSDGDEVIDVLDGFNYQNSDNGFRGGLSGQKLGKSLKVLVFDSGGGNAIPNAVVAVGADDPLVARTDANGVALITSEHLAPKATVTVARHCFQPITFVDIAIDTVTAYLDPVKSATCISPEGDLETGGGTPGQGAWIDGELVWPETEEFRRDSWSNIPDPKSDSEFKVAYVFQLASGPTDTFRTPSAVRAVTPASDGTTGYRFNLSTTPGTYTLYALAGIENRKQSPYAFTAYAMGVTRGVSVPAGGTPSDVFISVDAPLDHALELDISGPQATAKGPNRIDAHVAIRVGNDGYALLPSGQQSARLGTRGLSFVGVPPLSGSLKGTSYVAAVSAVTGSAGGLPRSVLGFLSTTSTTEPLAVGPFIEIPTLNQPAKSDAWNGRDLAWSSAPGGLSPDLAVLDVEFADGLYDWRIVAPGATRAVRLPDLGAIAEDIAWPKGEQSILVALARVDGFNYGDLRYRSFLTSAWTSYAVDAFFTSY